MSPMKTFPWPRFTFSTVEESSACRPDVRLVVRAGPAAGVGVEPLLDLLPGGLDLLPAARAAEAFFAGGFFTGMLFMPREIMSVNRPARALARASLKAERALSSRPETATSSSHALQGPEELAAQTCQALLQADTGGPLVQLGQTGLDLFHLGQEQGRGVPREGVIAALEIEHRPDCLIKECGPLAPFPGLAEDSA